MGQDRLELGAWARSEAETGETMKKKFKGRKH